MEDELKTDYFKTEFQLLSITHCVLLTVKKGSALSSSSLLPSITFSSPDNDKVLTLSSVTLATPYPELLVTLHNYSAGKRDRGNLLYSIGYTSLTEV